MCTPFLDRDPDFSHDASSMSPCPGVDECVCSFFVGCFFFSFFFFFFDILFLGYEKKMGEKNTCAKI